MCRCKEKIAVNISARNKQHNQRDREHAICLLVLPAVLMIENVALGWYWGASFLVFCRSPVLLHRAKQVQQHAPPKETHDTRTACVGSLARRYAVDVWLVLLMKSPSLSATCYSRQTSLTNLTISVAIDSSLEYEYMYGQFSLHLRKPV